MTARMGCHRRHFHRRLLHKRRVAGLVAAVSAGRAAESCIRLNLGTIMSFIAQTPALPSSRRSMPRAITRSIPGNSPPHGSCRGLQGFPGHEEQPQSLAIFHPACRALRRCQRMGKDLSGLGHVCLRYGIIHASFLPHCPRWRRHQSLLRSSVLCETPPLRDYCGNDRGHSQGNVEAEALK